ncbi:hypothetical protein O3M35_012523 [Rhynocoris fuscipes]|uniref:Uncharacterized protein n=1 Tax=Rhynocoris fuscipes TaxID=488301 RepID=A0AAW1CSP2_9HEMI
MPRYEVMKPKRSDYYLGEPIYYSHEWHPSVGGTGDVITSDSDTYIQKLKPKTIYVPRKKKSSYIKYTSPRYVRKEPVTVIRTSNATYPVVHEYKARSSKHVMKPVEVITTRPFAKHKSSTTFIEDTTSLDDHSVSQFSNMTIDDMSAINREVEAVLQQYEKVFDDTLTKEFEKRAATTKDNESVIYKTIKQATDAELLRKKKSPGVPETLTPEQIKLLSMDKPPLDKLKEIPVQYLKPRLPPYLKEKIILTSEVLQNPMNSSQPLAAGDSLRNHKKIVDLITECFSVNENDEMEGMNHRISHIDSTLCVEIMRKITDTLMKYQPNLLSTENVNKSVHLNILKQLRTDHLRHIQQEIKHIEDLDQFLHNFGLNNQSGDNDSKIYKLEVNLSDN